MRDPGGLVLRPEKPAFGQHGVGALLGEPEEYGEDDFAPVDGERQSTA
jgi:hypothetical protein